jgi:ubiquitin-protein ligase
MRKRLDELRKLRASYRARGLEFEQKYSGEEGWSDEEADESKKTQYVNAFAAKNAASAAVISTNAEVALKYQADHKNEVKMIARDPQNAYTEVKFTGDKVTQARALERRLCAPCKATIATEEAVRSDLSSGSMPYIPNHIRMALGSYVLSVFWDAFLNHEGDKAVLMILRMHVAPMLEEVNNKLSKKLPIDILRFSVDEDESVSFIDILDQFTSYLNKPNDDYVLRNPPTAFPACCVMKACHKHALQMYNSQSKGTSSENTETRSARSTSSPRSPASGGSENRSKASALEPSYALETNFNRWKLAKKGHAVRKKHIPNILDDAKISYDMSRLPDVWWRLYGEQLVEGSDVLMEVVEAIRTDMDDIRVQSVFTLPRWLKNEFTDSEIEFFMHHFKSIDLDGGGSIDAFEFQQLTVSLGCPVSIQEAQQILDDFDDDGSGTIDFIEFMTLMFRIQHGTLDLESNRLAQTIMESKAQLRILQEISDISKNPPVLGLVVDKYGGSPLVCDYMLRGPPNTPYAGGNFRLRVKYRNGYPFSCPDVNFITRILCVNVMPKVNGENHLVHLSHLWDCNWNTKRLLTHVDELLKRHDYSLIPSELYQLACSYGEDLQNNDSSSTDNTNNNLTIAAGKHGAADKKKAKALSVEEVLKSLPRVEQVLVTNTIIHMFDPKRFESLARSYTRRFSENFDEREAAAGRGAGALQETEDLAPRPDDGAYGYPMEAPEQVWGGEAVDWDEEVQYGNYDYDPNAASGQQYYYDETTGQYFTYDEHQYHTSHSEGNAET